MANYLKKRNDIKKRETMIVFVYDTECCQDEADDPVDAVLYFHPSWVSDTQKLSLCGQLMGTTHFLNECFFKPKIIALQNGKFVLKEFGRFILAVGTDRNLSDSLLEHRAELLTSLLKFFHRDIKTIYDQFLSTSSSSNTQYKNLSEKLYHIFETYLPILQYNGNIFQNIPKLRLPKSASNIFLDAIQTLQSCQQTKGVLGGTILYHNKVVATQLSAEITKNLILTDPFHIKSTAEPISVDFYVPIGVQLLIVYISNTEYQKLMLDSQKAQSVVTQSFSYNGGGGSMATSASVMAGPPSFQFQIKRKMKRDKSLIFTNIPEESHQSEESVMLATSMAETTTASATTIIEGKENLNTNIPINNPTNKLTTDISTINNKTSSSSSSSSIKTGLCRPNHLPLKFKNVTSKDIPESGFVSINFDESDSYPEFIGRTSVCSTPMTENKILQYDNIMSICSNPIQENIIKNNNSSCDDDNKKNQNHKNIFKSITNNGNRKFKIDFDKFFTNFINNPYKKFEKRSNSLTNINDSIKKSQNLTITNKMKFEFLKQQNQKQFDNNDGDKRSDSGSDDNCNGFNTPDFVDDVDQQNDQNNDGIKIKRKKMISRTITDPMYPVFNSDGEPISKSLFQEFLDKYYKMWNNDEKKFLKGNSNDQTQIQLTEDQNDENLNSGNGNKMSLTSLKYNDENLQKIQIKLKAENQIKNRKMLNLPLKPLNDLSKENQDNLGTVNINYTNEMAGNCSGIFERKKHTGIQLTPLMAKLSILALNEERSSGFCSWDTTPGIELVTTPIDGINNNNYTNKILRRKLSLGRNDDDLLSNEEFTTLTGKQFKKVELYICGQQNMTLLLLLEEGSAQKQNLIQAMFDTCVSKLTRIEAQLNQTLNVNVDGDKNEGGYSYIYVDQKWDTLQRGGPWSITDLDSLECIHKNLNLQHPITDLILRTDDNVLYGYKYGHSEIFYKQPVHSQSGLPPPADIMGTISMKARRRLERDHSLLLF